MDVIIFTGVSEIIHMPSLWTTSEERQQNLFDVSLALHERTQDVL